MNRTKLIEAIQQIIPGTDATGLTLGQSECIIVKEGTAYAFNDQVAVRTPVDLPFEGAINASKFLQALKTQSADEVKVSLKKDKVIVKGGKRQCTLTLQQTITLPLSVLDLPTRWRPLPEDFRDAVAMAAKTTSRDINKYTLTCVHIAPNCVEATDNIQLIRWPTTTGVRKSTLISSRAAIMLSKYNVVESGLTDKWIHFRDADGLVYSVRTHEDEYPDMAPYYEVEGHPIVFLPGIGEAATRAKTFLDSAKDDNIRIKVEDGMMSIEGDGSVALYEEKARVDYDGPPIAFFVDASICQRLAKEAVETIISDNRIKVVTDSYQYVAVLQAVEQGD